MKYTGRTAALSIFIISSTIFKINTFLHQGDIPWTEWVISAIFIYPIWWWGFQYDKGKFYEKELKKKEEELTQLFNSIDVVIHSLNLSTKNMMVSSKVANLYGYSAKDFETNQNLWKEVVHPDDEAIVQQMEQEAFKGKAVMKEYRIVLPNGDIKWVQKRLTPIFDSDGNLIQLNAVDIDIDSRKKVEALLQQTQEDNQKLLLNQLEESENRFKSLYVHNSDAIFTMNLDGKLIDTNQATEKLLGYTMAELKDISWDSIVLVADRDRYTKSFKYAINGKSQELSVSMVHKDGGKREVELKLIPIIHEHICTGIYKLAKDVTEAKLAEEMMRRSEKLSAVGELAAGVAHEIRNPLTTLKGFVQFLQPNLSKKYADIMLSELDRINLIVSEFLVLAKPQRIKYEYKDINLILQCIISLIDTQAIIKNIQIQLVNDLDIPLIKCEENQLKQVFINLLKNAIESMEHGGIIVVNVKQLKDSVQITVTDQGMGIPEEKIPRLGEPFFTTKEEGTGLGLMICHRIIEHHGGTINISSEAYKGTTVEVRLPI